MSLLNTPSFVFHTSIPFLPLLLTKITSLQLLFKSCSWWNQLFERQSVLSCEVVKGIKIVFEVSRENIKKRLKFVSLSIIQISTKKKKKRKRKASSCIQKWVFLAWCHLDEAVIVPEDGYLAHCMATSHLTYRTITTPAPARAHTWASCLTLEADSWTKINCFFFF